MNKKRSIILSVIIILIVLIIILIFNKPILRIFKKSEHLQIAVQDVDYAEIITDKDVRVKITDKERIKKLADYLNKVELIKEDSEYTEYEDNSITYLYLFGSLPSTAISIYENYLNFSDGVCWECTGIEYYIADSEYDKKSRKNKISVFLDELIYE